MDQAWKSINGFIVSFTSSFDYGNLKKRQKNNNNNNEKVILEDRQSP